MLNIGQNTIEQHIHREKYGSWKMISNSRPARVFARTLGVVFIFFFLVMFLPWTQNIRNRGYVTTLNPNERPQSLNSIIAGRIEKWFVREGNFVKKGDTIMLISEIKDEYFDPKLLERTKQQIQAKEMTVGSYLEKIKALDAQIDALTSTQELKLQQARNYIIQAKLKVQSDSIDYEAAKTNLQIAEDQLQRMEKLYKDGLKSLTDLETRRLKLQETQAKKISAQNKLLTSKNEYINAKVEINSIQAQYVDKLSKAESDKYSAMSSLYDAEALVTKMQNQYSNYIVRQGMYYITAPQNGYITQAVKSGIGETIKEGEELLTIMPSDYKLAVEMYVLPMDMPLVQLGGKVRVAFDGWPAIVFSGWPNTSYGTFGGEIVAIDNFISSNGKYRILVAPDDEDLQWPREVRIGAGASCITLFKDVSIGYEIWRNLNGFPPDYYKNEVAPEGALKPSNGKQKENEKK
jgi:membrane fusion protein, adhesin transport system